jgi:hypothetical protein
MPPTTRAMLMLQMPFVNHFHPSVSLQANQLLLSQPLTGSADISLNTLVSFLDRFVYRNPKKTLQPKGASIMQPAAAGDTSGMVVNNKGARSADGTYVNSEAFWRKKIADVPVDQVRVHVSLLGGKVLTSSYSSTNSSQPNSRRRMPPRRRNLARVERMGICSSQTRKTKCLARSFPHR